MFILSIPLISSIIKTLLRIVIALVISYVWIGIFPWFLMMCDVFPQDPFAWSCISRHGLIQGFSFVLIWLAIVPASTWIYIVGSFLLVILSVVGPLLTNGLELLSSANGWHLLMGRGYPDLIGGLLAFGLYSGVHYLVGKKRQNRLSNDR